MEEDLAHNILPTKNQSSAITRLSLRPKISEKVPKRGCVMVAAKRNAVPLQKAWLLFPPRSEVMAGNAAAIITASSAEIKAVRFNVKNAIQNRPDFPAKTFFLRGVTGGVGSASFSISSVEAAAESTVDMMNFPIGSK